MILNSKYGEVKIFTDNIEQEALSQVIQMSNSPLGKNANIRIMPDCHAGAGCTIGTTMKITDKVCPNLVGVDIGCGVDLIKTDIDFSSRLDELDTVIREYVPFGFNVHETDQIESHWFRELISWIYLDQRTKNKAVKSMGTLGGGNHFIEAYNDGYIAVHSGSRNIGLSVAKHYQHLASREQATGDRSLAYLNETDRKQYLNDVKVMTKFAEENRSVMLKTIVSKMGGKIVDKITSTHNYIGDDGILRKGAIQANLGQSLVIPLNMRDGMLVCTGKGNQEWNCSAPHGAGRLYSRSKAKKFFTLEEYKNSMSGIFSTCISKSTLDEAPFAYKDFTEIAENITDTVDIDFRLIPIFNFKAN